MSGFKTGTRKRFWQHFGLCYAGSRNEFCSSALIWLLGNEKKTQMEIKTFARTQKD